MESDYERGYRRSGAASLPSSSSAFLVEDEDEDEETDEESGGGGAVPERGLATRASAAQPSTMRRYSPPLERIKEEYSRMIAARLRAQRRGPRPPGPKIPDNSEPWMAEPKTVDDLWWIAQQVQKCVDQWGPRS